AAHAAAPSWARTAPRMRADLLRGAYERVLLAREPLADLIVAEMGKVRADALGEVDYAAEYLRWYAEEAVRIDGRWGSLPTGDRALFVGHRPVGPCLLVTPWNFPLAMAARKLAPALAAGCTTVLKPAAQTPLTALAFGEILLEAGLPAGTVNLVPTADAAALVGPLLADRRLRKLSFTGSTAVGRLLVRQSAERLLRTSMELGGNAPFVVFADADVAAAVDGALLAKMRNGGQACTAANRFLVHRSVYDAFLAGLVERMAALRVGPGGSGADVGPLIDATQLAKVQGLVDDACARGARTLLGGRALGGPGHFFAPTVLADVPPDARLLHEEVFGPVAPVVAFDDEQEALRLANDTEYGLVAYLYTADTGRALQLLPRFETGMVGINQGIVSNAAAPFGGVKASGMGREGGPEGLHEYLELQYAALPLDADVPACST
ncbi:MAG: NAD-dependent succinate-semialdehyde dehydrogenase, partial [Conexibacter sp.]